MNEITFFFILIEIILAYNNEAGCKGELKIIKVTKL